VNFDADASGNLYLAGSIEWEQARLDIAVQNLDRKAKTVWFRRLDTSQIDYATAVSTILGDGIYVVGTTDGLVNGSNQGGLDAFLLRLNAQGNRVWSR
jgi:hypothetical protein